ncbi:MAG: tryptophan synthase subunit alpha [Chloroflexi bacterium]|uniref:Tryptophan synthase alpha chain n=1 Tax=Candidatus Chlorohelix allophototropha TaxID=3003348 RepID=A0A8T7M069_9CHLR|nr:tryptophan synthase subunit alpha [Chloroflexota bacterium]WJW67029.1 tryptophan synthase subunit alpha [Chloroflexota bacterium L227-S17]
MSRIKAAFEKIKAEGRGACIAYVTIGFPHLEDTVPLTLALLEAGADMVELGVPFSDPLADGPTIQHASHIALENGVTRQFCFEVAREIRQKTDKPLLFMGYFNPIFSYGAARYIEECAAVGIDGLIVPDLALEETDELLGLCREKQIDLIQFIAPTSTDERIRKAAEVASGFIYCVSITGVTGARTNLPDYLPEYINRVRSFSDKPLVIGFGISSHAHFVQATGLADGAVCASALLDAIEKAPESQLIATGVNFIRNLTGTSKN